MNDTLIGIISIVIIIIAIFAFFNYADEQNEAHIFRDLDLEVDPNYPH